jgi:hypothetical protein
MATLEHKLVYLSNKIKAYGIAASDEEAFNTLIEAIESIQKQSKQQFLNDCVKHINRVGILNDCKFEAEMIADSVKEYFGDKDEVWI